MQTDLAPNTIDELIVNLVALRKQIEKRDATGVRLVEMNIDSLIDNLRADIDHVVRTMPEAQG